MAGDVLTPDAVYRSGQAIRILKWQRWAKGAKEKLEKMLQQDESAA